MKWNQKSPLLWLREKKKTDQKSQAPRPPPTTYAGDCFDLPLSSDLSHRPRPSHPCTLPPLSVSVDIEICLVFLQFDHGISCREEKKTATKKKKKLEDYLNPALLAEISSKIRRPKKVKDFGNESNWRNSEGVVVDLRDDSDPPMFDKSCSATQFQQFENMVSAIRDFPGK